jgi:ribosomal protein S18 acetylase RimI-like enzyme
MRKADIGPLTRLDAGFFGELSYPAAVFRQFWDLAGPLLQVAADGGKVIGYGLVAPGAEPATGWFLSLGVAAGWRRLGIGRALADTCLARAAAAGLGTLRLTVEPDNAPAILLYRSLGFSTDHTEVDYFGDGNDRVVMVRPGG